MLYFHTFIKPCCLWRRLSLLLYKKLAMIMLLSSKCLTTEFLIVYLNTFSLEWRNHGGKSTYAMEGFITSVHLRVLEEGIIFAILVRVY